MKRCRCGGAYESAGNKTRPRGVVAVYECQSCGARFESKVRRSVALAPLIRKAVRNASAC